MYKYVFGPVSSRRLGRSLGIDLLGKKTCTLDCLYCECGPDPHCVVTRSEFVPTRAVIEELDEVLASSPLLDSITFSGAGEPCLHSGLGEIISHLRTNHPAYRITVLTNGTLLTDPAVRRELAGAHLVVPSLDAVSDEAFLRINRPHPLLDNATVIGGLVAFRQEFTGQLWLEIFIVPGINDSPEELALLAKAVRRIAPDRIQINTLDRPAAYDNVRIPDPEELSRVLGAFPDAELVGSFAQPPPDPGDRRVAQVLGELSRSKATLEELRQALGLHIHEVHRILRHLTETGVVSRDPGKGHFSLL